MARITAISKCIFLFGAHFMRCSRRRELLDEVEHLIHFQLRGLLGELRQRLLAQLARERLRIGLRHEQIAQMIDQIREQPLQIAPCFRLLLHEAERAGRVRGDEAIAQVGNRLLRRKAEDGKHVRLLDLVAAKGHELIEHRLGVAHPPFRAARDGIGRLGRKRSIFSFPAISSKWPEISAGGMRFRSKRWQRERMVVGTFCTSVVAKKNFTCPGGSSRVLSSALKDEAESMCTSSTM